MSSSDISSLSSAESIDTDEDLISKPTKGTLDHYFKNGAAATKSASPPQKKKRPASPPHEYSLCDNPDIAVSHKTLPLARSMRACKMARC
jgi:hypothetical protein